MSKKDEALKLALEALEQYTNVVASVNNPDAWVTVVDAGKPAREAITAIREALASEAIEQPAQQQEPLTWKDEQGNVRMTLDAGGIQSSVGYVYSVHGERIKNACIRSDIPNGTPLYTSPPASKPWVGLTDEERTQFVRGGAQFRIVKAIEAKLKEKNT